MWNTKNESLQETIENCKEFSADVIKLKGAQRDEVLLRFYAETARLKADAVWYDYCAFKCRHRRLKIIIIFLIICSSYVKGLVREKLKFIVFGHHQVMLNALSACLQKLDVDFIRIDGSTRNDLRATYIDRFQTQKTCQVAVLSLKGMFPF